VKRLLQTSVLVLFSTVAMAQEPVQTSPTPTPVPAPKSAGPQIDTSSSVRINYAFAAWNKSPAKIDSGSLLMREGASGRMVQIHLSESEPDSSKFSGLYSISFQNIDRLKVEFYVPPQNLLATQDGMKKLAAMISSGKLTRNPFILRRTSAGQQSIEIFDTREQAQEALKAYRAEQQLQVQNQKYPSDQQVEMAKLTAEAAAKAAAAAAAAERVRMEQLEAQKVAAALARQAALDKAEKERRKKEAADLSAEGLKFYQEGKFTEAVEKFSKAIELDPDNRAYFFQYGVALYRTDKVDKSIVYLKMASGPQVNEVERDFYVGLAHFKLKEYPAALEAFQKAIAAKNPDLSPSAQFYAGVVHFEQKNWNEARNAFQAVLDTSKDPALDKQAETYLELVLRIQQFETERSRKWQFSATIGEQFDSNVTLTSDSTLSTGAQTNVAGYRSLFMGSGRYRPVYDEAREFAAQLDLLYMYTVDSSFGSSQSLRNADPLVVTLTMPWTHKGLVWGKGFKSDITPGYESITMSAEDNTSKVIISSVLLNFTNLIVMNDKLYSNFNLELRRDQNEMASVTGDNDSTAIKTKLVNSNLHFLGDSKSKFLTSEIDLTFNTAQGSNATYNRLDLAVGYIQPFYWETSALAKLAYYYLTYPLKSDNRIDNDVTVTAGLTKKLNDTYSTGFVGTYQINNSTSDSYTYKKWTAMLTLSALTAF